MFDPSNVYSHYIQVYYSVCITLVQKIKNKKIKKVIRTTLWKVLQLEFKWGSVSSVNTKGTS